MNNCLYCNKEISGKAKYCSEAHSKAYRRKIKAGQLPGQNDPILQPGQARTGLTRTDAKFEANKPNYYNYGALHKSKCQECGAEFKTRMELLRFCSPQHMEAALKSLSPL
jgi:hypothetical protein